MSLKLREMSFCSKIPLGIAEEFEEEASPKHTVWKYSSNLKQVDIFYWHGSATLHKMIKDGILDFLRLALEDNLGKAFHTGSSCLEAD